MLFCRPVFLPPFRAPVPWSELSWRCFTGLWSFVCLSEVLFHIWELRFVCVSVWVWSINNINLYHPINIIAWLAVDWLFFPWWHWAINLTCYFGLSPDNSNSWTIIAAICPLASLSWPTHSCQHVECRAIIVVVYLVYFHDLLCPVKAS